MWKVKSILNTNTSDTTEKAMVYHVSTKIQLCGKLHPWKRPSLFWVFEWRTTQRAKPGNIRDRSKLPSSLSYIHLLHQHWKIKTVTCRNIKWHDNAKSSKLYDKRTIKIAKEDKFRIKALLQSQRWSYWRQYHILIKCSKILITSKLVNKMKSILHTGHLGIKEIKLNGR